MSIKRPLVLIVRDGWGTSPFPQYDQSNAIKLAKHPIDDKLMATYPHVLIHTSGFDVGLPKGTMGNSEVGHQNIGAGRIVDQESGRISRVIHDGKFFGNAELNAAVDHAKTHGKKLHLFGIVSDAGVHGLLEHLFAILELCQKKQFTNVFLHAFTDGRDSPPSAGVDYLKAIEAKMAELKLGKIATVAGRFWAMDRDKRWPRVEKAYRAIRFGEGPTFNSAVEAVQNYYDHASEPTTHGDEFVTPSVIVENGKPIATVDENDSVIFYNYRGDRPRELTHAFVLPDFTAFDRGDLLKLYFVTMAAYEDGLPVHVAFPKEAKMKNILGEIIANLGHKQFRCAETEKFPHVTFFFNDYREQPFPGEDREIIQSPKTLPDGKPLTTYDQQPEMSAFGVRDATVKAIDSGLYDLVVVNFANGDMVGHTGTLAAAIKAVETVDQCVGAIYDAVEKQHGAMIVTADHGNAEEMVDPRTGGPYTAHTVFDVECIVVDDRFKGRKLRQGGRLADIAPTALEMMGLPVPAEMTGKSLLQT